MASRQIECEKILPPHLATAVNARHFDKARHPIEADRDVPKFGESLQIASGAATEIEQSEGTLAMNVIQHRRDVLRDVVPARALPESVRDVKHSQAWNANVLHPLVRDQPETARAIAEGALMRLEAGRRCFDRHRAEFGIQSDVTSQCS